MPSALSTVTRRRVLAGGGLLALMAVAAPACGSTSAPTIDELEAQRDLARHDSELAATAAATAPRALGRALTEVAAERAEQARALTTEIVRLAGKPEATPINPTETSATAGVTEPPMPTVADVVNALRSAADSAGKLAAKSAGYRAGLLASIAAACTTAHTVALAAKP